MNQNIFMKDVRMDTQTAFLANGNINIWPCAWETDKVPFTEGRRASFRGRIRVEEDGRTQVTRYNIGSQGPLYTLLYETEHCQVMRTPRGKIIERWSFPPEFTADDKWEFSGLIRRTQTTQTGAEARGNKGLRLSALKKK